MMVMPLLRVVEKEGAGVGSSTRDTSGLEGATAALSLKPSGPPGFTFRYLRPIRRIVGEDGDDDEYEDPEDVGHLLAPGARYLLDEWKPGEQPSGLVSELSGGGELVHGSNLGSWGRRVVATDLPALTLGSCVTSETLPSLEPSRAQPAPIPSNKKGVRRNTSPNTHLPII
jgi:hypothetical protein